MIAAVGSNLKRGADQRSQAFSLRKADHSRRAFGNYKLIIDSGDSRKCSDGALYLLF